MKLSNDDVSDIAMQAGASDADMLACAERAVRLTLCRVTAQAAPASAAIKTSLRMRHYVREAEAGLRSANRIIASNGGVAALDSQQLRTVATQLQQAVADLNRLEGALDVQADADLVFHPSGTHAVKGKMPTAWVDSSEPSS